MIEIVGPRRSGRSTQLILEAARLQDEGYSVLIAVPEARYINHLYPLIVEHLDPSRVILENQFGAYIKASQLGPEFLILVDDYDRWNVETAIQVKSLGSRLAVIVKEG